MERRDFIKSSCLALAAARIASRLTDGKPLRVDVENGHAVVGDQVMIHEGIVLETNAENRQGER
jgi:hypothetical protein